MHTGWKMYKSCSSHCRALLLLVFFLYLFFSPYNEQQANSEQRKSHISVSRQTPSCASGKPSPAGESVISSLSSPVIITCNHGAFLIITINYDVLILFQLISTFPHILLNFALSGFSRKGNPTHREIRRHIGSILGGKHSKPSNLQNLQNLQKPSTPSKPSKPSNITSPLSIVKTLSQ